MITNAQSKYNENQWIDDETRQVNNQDLKKFLQNKRKRMKIERLKEKYISRCKHFLESYDQLEACLKNVLSSNATDELLSICYIFGTSPISPKEIYRLKLPKGNLETSMAAIPFPHTFSGYLFYCYASLNFYSQQVMQKSLPQWLIEK